MENINTLKIALLLFTMAIVSGCATIVSDSSYPVSIDTVPTGAEFTITNKRGVVVHSAVAPATVVLKSGAGYFKREEYSVSCKNENQDTDYILGAEMDGWYIGNLLFGGLIGFLIVDPLTGSMWKLPDTVSIHMDGSTPVVKKEEFKESDSESFY